jgi:hypothetical protein
VAKGVFPCSYGLWAYGDQQCPCDPDLRAVAASSSFPAALSEPGSCRMGPHVSSVTRGTRETGLDSGGTRPVGPPLASERLDRQLSAEEHSAGRLTMPVLPLSGNTVFGERREATRQKSRREAKRSFPSLSTRRQCTNAWLLMNARVLVWASGDGGPYDGTSSRRRHT